MKLVTINRDQWETLINKCIDITPFQMLSWLEILSTTWPEISLHLLLIVENGVEIGLIPVMTKKRFGLKLVGSPLRGYFSPYMGPLLFDNNQLHYPDLLSAIFEMFKPDFFDISLPALQLGSWSKFEYSDTIHIDLTQGKDSLYRNMRKSTRNQVKQSKKFGVEIYSPAKSNGWLADYYAMVNATYSRQKILNPAPIDFYKKVWQKFNDQGIIKVILAKYKEKIIAGSIYLIWNNIIYGLDGVSYRDYQQLRANNLVEWETISWATSNGIHTYDMVGANIPSIAHFKKGFGGSVIKYPIFEAKPTLKGKMAWKVYNNSRSLVKRLIKL